MLVRLMMERDIPRVVALGQMQCSETTPHMRFNIGRAISTCQAAIKTADPTIFVAERSPDRHVVGYLIAQIREYMHADGFLVQQEIVYVEPASRGGRAFVELVREFSRWAKSLGPDEIYVGVANGFNAERTARLFQKLDFTPVGSFLRSVAA